MSSCLILSISQDLFGLTVIVITSLSTKPFFVNFRAHQAIPQFPQFHPGMAASMAGMGLFYPEALGGCIGWFTHSVPGSKYQFFTAIAIWVQNWNFYKKCMG